MLETLQKLREALTSNRSVAYCRLVETRGSTPQKAGAMMLVYENGEQEGTLGGGCVEAEVKRNAIAALKSKQSEIATFNLDHDYGWDDGLICGGRMSILIEPLLDSSPYFESLVELADSRQGFTEAIVFDAKKWEDHGAVTVPSSLLFDVNGQVVSALHAGPDQIEGLAEALSDSLRPIAKRPRPYAEQGVAFLPLLPRCRLVVVGGGHIGQAVASLAADLDFQVCVTDDRGSYVGEDRFPRADERIAGPCGEVLPSLEITPDTYCLIVTRGHNHDQEALYHLINRGARYVGMIGSKRKIRKIFEDLADEGISQEVLDTVYAPVGLDIGSQTVPEIAVSIAAELIAHRNLGGDVPGRRPGESTCEHA